MLGMLPKKQSSKRRKKSKFARLDVWAHAQIVILAKEGVKPQSIRRKVRKTDGTMPTPRAVRDTIAKARADPEWRGQNKAGPGRNKSINPELQEKMRRLVFRMRGRTLVTIKFMKQRFSRAQTNPSVDNFTRLAPLRAAVAPPAC